MSKHGMLSANISIPLFDFLVIWRRTFLNLISELCVCVDSLSQNIWRVRCWRRGGDITERIIFHQRLLFLLLFHLLLIWTVFTCHQSNSNMNLIMPFPQPIADKLVEVVYPLDKGDEERRIGPVLSWLFVASLDSLNAALTTIEVQNHKSHP